MGKTITRKEYEKMLRDAFGTIAGNKHLPAKHQATNVVNNVLIDLEIPIPDTCILPDAADGEWEAYVSGDASHWSIGSTVLSLPIARDISCEGTAQVMAGSKKLIELVVANLGVTYDISSVNIIKQLEKMGVDMSNFGR